MKYHFSMINSIVFIIHLLAYTIHTPFSVGYHTFNSISEEEHIKWRKYDVYGIFLRCILISFTLSFFTYDNFKYVLMNVSLTILTVYYAMLKFKEREDDKTPLDKFEQGKLIGYVVLTYSLPIFYKIYNSIITKNYDLPFKISILNVLIIIIFGSMYAFRIPERFFKPGTFNKFGTSHNIMHFGVIMNSICETLYIYLMAKQGKIINTFK